jgi:hypothetical protein
LPAALSEGESVAGLATDLLIDSVGDQFKTAAGGKTRSTKRERYFLY